MEIDLQTNGVDFHWEKRICVDCGNEFIAKSPKSTRCLECRLVREKERKRKYDSERYTEVKELRHKAKQKKEADDKNICKRRKSCYYGGKAGAEYICDYLAITGVRRPCPAGSECVMYKRKGR